LPNFDGKGKNLGVEKGDSSVDQPREGGNELFDRTEIDGFDSVFDAKRRKRGRSRPEYRRVRRYFKGTKQYWRERSRRKQVFELSEKHLTYKQIAEQLGLSERTVKRDMTKIKPYYMRQIRSYYSRLEEERRGQVEAQLEGKSLAERFKILSSMILEIKKRDKEREYNRHQMFITIDLDDVTDGYPAVKPWPQQSTVNWTLPLTINFLYVKNGEKRVVGNFTLSRVKQHGFSWQRLCCF
jgi:DNA-binding CsgD family transcriptional regulator